ncbi:MAG: ATP-binding cassette domain-containing protein [Chloroflexota bacterium]|jgi:ABC-2 type transport system ATP-binding protein
MQYTVEALNLTKKFGDFTAVDGVSFQVGRGEIFAFLGPNGCGKTTTIRMLCGIITPTSGTGKVAGFDIREESDRVKEHIGYMSQRFSLYEELTARENLEFYAGVYQVPQGKQRSRIDELIAMAGLEGRGDELAANLSGGWRQRLALACSIVHSPPILFLDEPTAGVDPVSRRRVWDMIYDLSDGGVTVFVTTHYMDEAEHAHRVSLMLAGKLVACESPESLKAAGVPGSLLEVECEPVVPALDLLPTVDGVKEVAVYGSMLHLVVEPSDDRPALVRESLERHGLVVRKVEAIRPSLEDVFISVLSR